MEFKRFSAAAAALLFLPVAAKAFEVEGADLGFSYYDEVWGGSDVTDAAGRLDLRFGRIGTQVDALRYESEIRDVSAVGLHVYYEVSPQFVAGGVYNYEDWGFAIYQTYGLEARYDAGKWGGEAFYLASTDLDAPDYDTEILGVTGFYDLTGAISLGGHAASVSGDDEGTSLGIAGSYSFQNGLVATLGVNDEEYSGTSFTQATLGLRLLFGATPTFGRRDFLGVLPGY